MAGKKHITALGVPFDMAAFRAKNEKTRAVGNMNVNARGDILDSNNNVIENRNNIVNKMYEKTMQSHARPKTQTVQASTKNRDARAAEMDDVSAKELEDLDDDVPNPKK